MMETGVEINEPPQPIAYTNGNGLAHAEPEPVPVAQKIERKIAIFGTTPSRMAGPWQDDSGWERWTIGPGGKDAHNWERLFEIHGVWPADFEGYLNDLSLVEKPRQIVMLPQKGLTWEKAIARWHQQHGKAPDTLKGNWSAAVSFPRDEILDYFQDTVWFSSTISWCIALAMMEGASDIGLWGIDLESGEEYISQWLGCKHLMAVARHLGINVQVEKDCGLLRDVNPYPDRYETHLALTLEKKVNFINQAIANLEPEFEARKADVHRHEGQILLMREILNNNLVVTPELIPQVEQSLIGHNTRVGQLACNINQLKGELGASTFYRRMFVWGHLDPEQTGG